MGTALHAFLSFMRIELIVILVFVGYTSLAVLELVYLYLKLHVLYIPEY